VDKPSQEEIRQAAGLLEKKTGKPARFWIPLLKESPFEDFDQMVLKHLAKQKVRAAA
jgi:hypothetical protein